MDRRRPIARRRFLKQAALAGLAPLTFRLERIWADRTIWILRPATSDFHLAWASAELARGLRTLGFSREPVQAALGSAEPAADAAVFTLAAERQAFRHAEAFEISRERGVAPEGVRITGATPRAVLYGVCLLLERQGAFFGLDGEVYPLEPPPFLTLPPPERPWIELPRFDVRGLIPWPNPKNGLEALDREDLRAYLEAMVRMRFNTLALHAQLNVPQWVEALRYAATLGIRTGIGFEPAIRVDPDSVAARDRVDADLGALLDMCPDADDVWLWRGEETTWLQVHRFLQRHAPGKRVVLSGATRHFGDLHKRLPDDIVFSSAPDTFGSERVSEAYGRLGRRTRWPVLSIEDPATWLPPFQVHRLARDIDRAAGFGCQGLLGVHRRDRILDATAGFHARHCWHGDLLPEQFYGELARTYAREPRAGRLAAVLNDADRDRRLVTTRRAAVGTRPTREDESDLARAFAFWHGDEPSGEMITSHAEVARALRGLAGAATSDAERERVAYLAGQIGFVVPYAESCSLAWRLHRVLQRARELRQTASPDQARRVVATEGVPIWLALAPLVREAILTCERTVSTRGDLGMIATMHSQYEQLALTQLRLSMKEFLVELPPDVDLAFDAARMPDPDTPPRVIVPTRPTVLRPGERVLITALVMGGTPVADARLHARAGPGVWTTTPMRPGDGQRYAAELGWIDETTEVTYFVEADVTTAADSRVWTCRAPLEAPRLVYTLTLVSQAARAPAWDE